MKIALVHDDLVQWGGAERVLSAISEVFPNAPIYTSVFDINNPLLGYKFKGKKIITSFMQKIPGWKALYKALLPLYPIAFEQFDFSDFDIVISQTTRFAKSIITKPETMHICYCHTPPRFLWGFSGEKVSSFLKYYINKMRIYDQVTSSRVDKFLAGSKNSHERIKKIYNRDSKVLFPFVDLNNFSGTNIFDGNYFLIIARLNKYKRIDIAVKLFAKRKEQLIIIGTGPELSKLKRRATGNVRFLENVPEDLLINLISGCKALIITADEDFGLTALEAQACGKGVIAYKKGGVLETVSDNNTGILFGEQSEESLNLAIEKFYKNVPDSKNCIEMAKKFSKEKFQAKLLECIILD